jgi:hypothetical protein
MTTHPKPKPLKPGDVKVGDIYEDCAYHPVVCEEVEDEGENVSGVSLLDGSRPRSCSLQHCGVRLLTKEEADKSIEAWKKGGRKALMMLHGWSEENADAFIKQWT